MKTRYSICAMMGMAICLMVSPLSAQAQHPNDTIVTNVLSETEEGTLHADSDLEDRLTAVPSTLQITPEVQADSTLTKHKRDWETWRPNPKRALWLALVLPGAGQIYNRKFWKLPIIYGGFVGCAYAMRWNNMMYRDYSQAYLDIMDDDPSTQSYNQFLHLGNTITEENMDRWKEIFHQRKDRYRRWRDMSFFVMVGVYVLSVVDAYVDASLSEFDISSDLSLRISPAIINGNMNGNINAGSIRNNTFGLQCSLNF